MYEQKNFLVLARALLATQPSLTHLVKNTKDSVLGRIITSYIAESFGGMPEWRTLAEAIEDEARIQGRLLNFGDPHDSALGVEQEHEQHAPSRDSWLGA